MAISDLAVSKRAELRATGAVARAVLLGALVSIAGCIIPTPLEQQHPTVNSPPKILTDEVMPKAGVAFTETTNSVFEFSIAASDADLEDTLTARLLIASPPSGTPHVVNDAIPLVASSGSDKTVRTGVIPSTSGQAYCAFLTGAAVVFVYVTDRSFDPGDTADTSDNDSDRDGITWQLTCAN